MKSFRDINPYVVGVVSVLLLGAMVGVAFAVGTFNLLEKTYEMEGVFADASGLRVDDDVKLAGVEVGRVTDIEVDRASGNVRVTWVVNQGVDIGEDSGAEIALSSLLGAKHIRILDPRAGERLMEDLPSEQRVVDLERTKVPYDIFRLTRVSTRSIEELNTDQLNELLVDLADITDGKGATVADLIEGINEVGGAINSREDQFATLLDEVDRLSATLADKDDELLTLVDSSAQVLDLIIERRNDLSIVLGEGADTIGELDRLIAENKEQIDSVLDSLAPTLDVVARHQDDIDAGLAWLGPAILQQSRAGGNGPWSEIFVASLGPADSGITCDLLMLAGLADETECSPT